MIDVTTLIFYAMIGVFVLYGLRLISQNNRDRLRYMAISKKKEEGRLHMGDSIFEVLNNAPKIIQQLGQMRADMVKKGATAEQLKPIDQRIHWIQTLQQWEIPLRFGAPVIDRVVDKLIPFIERLILS